MVSTDLQMSKIRCVNYAHFPYSDRNCAKLLGHMFGYKKGTHCIVISVYITDTFRFLKIVLYEASLTNQIFFRVVLYCL